MYCGGITRVCVHCFSDFVYYMANFLEILFGKSKIPQKA